ncbi:MAG: EF-Tu/IF-2/RF-3 family GTPase [Methanomassiliicoccus sp.]|nr:EF-Tu/IF-2/RF-3 family GTPase [Methanomassiliicoccus sp.]
MANLNVAVIGPNDYAKDLGKKGTASDITLYDLKQGTDTVTFIEPTKYPDRLAPLFYAVSMADRALVVVEAINAQLGECIVMLQCAGVKEGYIILRNYLTREQLAPLTKGTVLEAYRFVEDDKNSLREMLISEAKGRTVAQGMGKGAVPIDHFFNVKGVGTVILGYVAYGRIEKHDDLKVLPTNRTALVRSIQKHDDDFDDAVHGDRVGLALKNIDVEQLDRGYVLTEDSSIRSDSSVTAQAELVNYWKMPLKEGMVLHLGHWMQFIGARVEAVKDGGDFRRPTISLTLDKPVVHPPGSRAVIMYLEGGKLRVAGSIVLP